MTLRLVVMRHAKSDWESGVASDHERPLNARGRAAAPKIAQRLVDLGWTPAVVRGSDSRRTRETFEFMRPELPEVEDVLFSRTLYLAGPRELVSVLVGLSETDTPVLALGHNPGWQEAVEYFAGTYIALTTGNAALLSIEADHWPDGLRREHHWKLVDVLRPKDGE